MNRFLRVSLILVVLLLIVGAGVGAYAWYLLQPVSSTPVQAARFVIPKDQSLPQIAERLTEAGYIRHPLVFRLVVRQQGLGSKIQYGSFELSPSMTPAEVAQELTQGTSDIWVTLPEGWRMEEIAESLERQELDAFDVEEFKQAARSYEGKLFPDTYLIPRHATAESLVELFTGTFERKIIQGLETEIAASERDFGDVLVMASLVEREARDYEQMRHVAGILWNRIDIGMPLQVDATLQYAAGYNTSLQKWWVPPTGESRKTPSPFNTYLNPGLPPRPIANPGLNALRATLDPLDSDELFYIHDDAGGMHYARTLEEHNRNIDQYLR